MITPTPYVNERINHAELRGMFQAVYERLDQVEAELIALRDGLATAASPAAIMPERPAWNTVQFDASIILVGVDDAGQPTYKAKGGQYSKFGVRIWPEVLPELGIDPTKLNPGPNPVNLRLIALMGEKGPRKVIHLMAD